MEAADVITSRLQWAVAFRDRIVPPSAYTVQASSTSLSVLCAGDGEDVARAAARSSHSLGKIFVVDEGEPQGGCGDAVERLQGVSVAGVPLPRAGADSPPSQAMHGLCFLAFPHPAGDATRDEDALQRVVTELRRRMQPRCVAVWVRQRAPGPESEQAPLLRPESLRRIAAGTGAAHWEASSALGLLALAWGANEPEPGTGEQQQSDAAKDGGAAPPHGLPSACPARHEDHSPTVASGSQFGDLFARSHATEASSAERSLWPRLRALVASRVRGSEWATESLMGVVEPLARRQAASLAAQGQGQGPGDGGEVTSDADIYAALATAFHDHVRTDSRYKPPKPGANGGANAGASGAAAGAEIPRKRPCPGPAPAGPATEATRSAGKPKPRRQDHLVRKAMRAFPGNGRFRARSLLDVGCAEGNVTAELGRQLGVPPDALHGCDVRAVAAKEHRGFDFRQYDGQSLPYADASFHVVSAFMVLHHIRHAPSVVAEVARVLQPGGLFLIREHDCAVRGLPVLLDIMHGLYALVWKRPSEWPLFLSEYQAFYRSKDEWDAVMRSAGLFRVRGPSDKLFHEGSASLKQGADGGPIYNAAAAYFAVYRKAGGGEGASGDRDRHGSRHGRRRWRRRGRDN